MRRDYTTRNMMQSTSAPQEDSYTETKSDDKSTGGSSSSLSYCCIVENIDTPTSSKDGSGKLSDQDIDNEGNVSVVHHSLNKNVEYSTGSSASSGLGEFDNSAMCVSALNSVGPTHGEDGSTYQHAEIEVSQGLDQSNYFFDEAIFTTAGLIVSKVLTRDVETGDGNDSDNARNMMQSISASHKYSFTETEGSSSSLSAYFHDDLPPVRVIGGTNLNESSSNSYASVDFDALEAGQSSKEEEDKQLGSDLEDIFDGKQGTLSDLAPAILPLYVPDDIENRTRSSHSEQSSKVQSSAGGIIARIDDLVLVASSNTESVPIPAIALYCDLEEGTQMEPILEDETEWDRFETTNVHTLAIDNEGEHILPFLSSLPLDGLSSKTRQHVKMLYIFFWLCAIALFVSSLSVFSFNRARNNMGNEGIEVIMGKREQDVTSLVISISGEDVISDPSTPQHAAYEWIMYLDPLQLNASEVTFIQRYVLAVFYFGTDEDATWRNCGSGQVRNGKSACEEDQQRFLSGYSECQWYGIDCSQEKILSGINLGKFGWMEVVSAFFCLFVIITLIFISCQFPFYLSFIESRQQWARRPTSC